MVSPCPSLLYISRNFRILFLPFLPLLPVQILLNNLLSDISQITIPTDHVDPSFVRKPKRWNIDMIKKAMFYIGPVSSLFDFLTFLLSLSLLPLERLLSYSSSDSEVSDSVEV